MYSDYRINSYWLEYHGRIITIDGLKYRIDVSVHSHPTDPSISVLAYPISKTSKHYRDIKRILGDDWVTDVLNSEIEVETNILEQLGHKFEARN